jgi:hypothetical protein
LDVFDRSREIRADGRLPAEALSVKMYQLELSRFSAFFRRFSVPVGTVPFFRPLVSDVPI